MIEGCGSVPPPGIQFLLVTLTPQAASLNWMDFAGLGLGLVGAVLGSLIFWLQ